ncbi:MAG: HU family DNA-binding protein [Clostridia bacterium]|nr:HU family DNA-binding protein [Clostridia bacterium]
MNKTELVAAVAEKAGLTKDAAAKAVNALTEVVTETLKAGDKIVIAGFGTYEAKKREARVAHNPRTREEIKIAATTVPAFKAGKTLKDALK